MKKHNKLVLDFVIDVIILALLIVLFIYPAIYTKNTMNDIINGANEAVFAIHESNYDVAVQSMRTVCNSLDEAKEPMMLFLNHEELHLLEASVNGCLQLALAKDDAQILLELESIIVRAHYLNSIEHFSIYNLL